MATRRNETYDGFGEDPPSLHRPDCEGPEACRCAERNLREDLTAGLEALGDYRDDAGKPPADG